MNPHKNLFSQYPLVQLAVPFCLGICAVPYVPAPVVCGAICSAAVLAALIKDRLKLAGWTLLAAMFFVGAVMAMQERPPLLLEPGTMVLTGVLDGPPEFARDRVYLTLRVEQGLIALVGDPAALDLRYGSRVQVTATISRNDQYRNPGVSPLSEYL